MVCRRRAFAIRFTKVRYFLVEVAEKLIILVFLICRVLKRRERQSMSDYAK